MNATPRDQVTSIEVIPPGTKVMLCGDKPALITGVTVTSSIKYCVSYWNGQQLAECWIDPGMIEKREDAKTQVIGFAQVPSKEKPA